ncbi:helix-turn-helix domain-containing protein [Methylobacterium sp. EM32]|uniref:helix-turn-helix domain-containing protein n=1 Tax=Methylobacterium sp. EM32 TaxID=3163481 RepID=UPI0033B10437
MILEHRFEHIAEPGRRRRAWITSLAPIFDASVPTEAEVPITAFQRYQHLGQMVLAADEVPAQSVERSPERIRDQGLDHLVLRTTVSGSIRVDVGGSPVEAAPGDLLVLDLARPIRMETEQGRGATLFLPRHIFGDRADELASMHGGVLAGSAYPLAQLLSDFLRHFNECAVSATPGLTHHLVPATVDLCRALAWEVSGSATAAPSGDTQLRFAVQQFIERHLAQVDLPMLSAQFGLSRTPLYQLFAPDGGVYAYIRDRRLTEAMRRLRHSEGRRPKIARLAHDCGFHNDLVFSRAFRRKYGVNPSDVEPGPEMRLPLPTDAPLLSWLREL